MRVQKSRLNYLLLLQQLFLLKKIEPTEDEINTEAEKIGSSYGMDAEQVKKAVSVARIAEDVARNKAVGFNR